MTVPTVSQSTIPTLPDRYNVSTILDSNLEGGRGAKVALRGAAGEATYQRLFDDACAAGRALRALGVQREQRVLLVLDDGPAFPAAFLGAVRAGMVPVPLNPLFKPDDYGYLLADSDAQAVIVDMELLDKVREALAAHSERIELIVVGGAAEGAHSFAELLAEHAGELAPANTHRDDPAFWLYSSGSTGRPKGVVHLQHDLPYTCQTYATQVLGIREDDVCLSTTKLFHAYGFGNSLSFPFWVGATAVQLRGRPIPDRVFEAVERFRPTLLFSVPTLYNAMLRSPGAERRDLSSVRLCVSAAESLPADIWRRWHDTYGLVIWTASAPPRCSTSSAPTPQPSCGPGPAASLSPATT
jgi:acyl-coenzyme A synthetase/AMP-(fatty) acid ligase